MDLACQVHLPVAATERSAVGAVGKRRICRNDSVGGYAQSPCTLLWLMNLHGSSRSVVGRCVAGTKRAAIASPENPGFSPESLRGRWAAHPAPYCLPLGTFTFWRLASPRGARSQTCDSQFRDALTISSSETSTPDSALLRSCGFRGRVELLSAEVGIVFEHAVDRVEEFSHDGNQGHQLLFATRQELLIVRFDLWFPLHGD